MTDVIDELITEYYETHANYVDALDCLDMDPIFKWSIKRRLWQIYKEGKELEPAYGIVTDFFKYHIDSDNSLGFRLKLFGQPTYTLELLREKLKCWLGRHFTLEYREVVSERPYPYTSFICLTERGKGKENILRELKDRESIITLELMARHKDDNRLCRCLIYDMFFNKLGFVDIKV